MVGGSCTVVEVEEVTVRGIQRGALGLKLKRVVREVGSSGVLGEKKTNGGVGVGFVMVGSEVWEFGVAVWERLVSEGGEGWSGVVWGCQESGISIGGGGYGLICACCASVSMASQ